ncbi:sensor domain-containing protein [Calidifontibacillus erzurumensis]|uniref:sensor domain-containing protein n=1 Tax=Calidifontibacillus erzurumensis TaxID=2741433 RepID=UPI0035B51666
MLVNLSINEKKYRILLHKSPLGIMIIKDRKFKFLNQYALQSLGFKNEKEIIGKSVLSFIHPNYHDLVLSRFHTVLEQKQPVEIIEEEWINANGETITVEVLSIPFHFMGDDTNLTIFRDITEKKRSSHYFQELINIKGALEKSSIVEIIDDNGIIKYVNDKFCKISKYEPSEVIGKSYEIMKSGFHSEQFYNELWDTLKQGKVWEGEIQNRAKDGTYYWVQTMVLPFINNNGHPYQFLIIKNDITDKKEAQKEIQELATKDHLTQLLNRRAFEEKLQELMNDKVNSAVFFLDLDRFKYINDSLGHSTGDILLKLVANRLRTLTDLAPFDSVIARFGGDEFAMLVPCNNKKLITNFAKNIMKEISLPYNIDGKELFITCSIGISFYPDHGNDLGTLMKNADIAMYWAKHNGKNDYSIYQNYMTKIPTEIMELELELRKAVEKKEFELYYQPKIDLFTKEIVGCEALIRWNHPWKGIVPPSKFIPLAEETGLINPIGEWVLKEACQQSKILQNAGFPEFQMAVNISVHQFRQENFVDMIKKVLMETQLEPRLLELEITESFLWYPKKRK